MSYEYNAPKPKHTKRSLVDVVGDLWSIFILSIFLYMFFRVVFQEVSSGFPNVLKKPIFFNVFIYSALCVLFFILMYCFFIIFLEQAGIKYVPGYRIRIREHKKDILIRVTRTLWYNYTRIPFTNIRHVEMKKMVFPIEEFSFGGHFRKKFRPNTQNSDEHEGVVLELYEGRPFFIELDSYEATQCFFENLIKNISSGDKR